MGNWYCTNCRAYKDSWAEHQNYKPEETFRRDIRCYSCDGRYLTYSDSQKEEYKRLVKERTHLSGSVKEVERFSTWWNNNIATAVIYYNNGNYRVFLLVYDSIYSTRSPAVFPEDGTCSYWGEKSRGRHSYLSDASNEAEWLRDKLVEENGRYWSNPILLIHPQCDVYKSFYNYVSRPYVIREEVGNSDSTHLGFIVIKNISRPANSSLDEYFKPLDIVKVKEVHSFFGTRYYHYGVCLGNGEICEFTRRINGVRNNDWRGFLKDQIGELYRYHPVVPFKHYDKIVRQIVASERSFWEDRYDLLNRNCEHFANMIGLGINYSDQIEDNKNAIRVKESAKAAAASSAIATSSIALAPFTFGLSLVALPATAVPIANLPTLNNGKGSTIKLTNEINETNNKLGWKTNDRSEEIGRRYLQEIPPKQSCRIM